ncbi:MAG: phage regulatory protein/antirepressor Ant [Paraclostridium sp.]
MGEIVRVENIDAEDIVRISSREVAVMMEIKEHSKMLRKIDDINEVLGKAKVGSAKYWTESTYKDSQNKERREYLVSKEGCEFLAHKTIGEKGVLFTVKYMEKFKQLEEENKMLKEAVNEKAQLLLQIYNGGTDGAIAAKRLTEIEVEEATQPLIETIEVQKPEVEFATRVQEDNQKVYSIAEAAKLLKLPYGNRTLFAKLRDMKVLRQNNEPYQDYINRELFMLKITDTGYKLVSTTKVTGKGLRWLEKKREELIS